MSVESIPIGPSYYRFNGGRPYAAPKDSIVDMKPIVVYGRDKPWPPPPKPTILIVKENDRLVGYEIRLTGFDLPPKDGRFEFWVKHWSGDQQDEEWPWMHWAFQNVKWKGQSGECEVKRHDPDLTKPFSLRGITGWMYVKHVPGTRSN